MIPNLHQSIEDIFKNASPEQKIFYQHIRLIVGENAAIKQSFFQGISTGSIFLTYNAHRLWVALEFSMQLATGAAQIQPMGTFFYDENDVLNRYSYNSYPYWDTAIPASRFFHNSLTEKNIYFSRVVLGVNTYFKFIGFEITY